MEEFQCPAKPTPAMVEHVQQSNTSPTAPSCYPPNAFSVQCAPPSRRHYPRYVSSWTRCCAGIARSHAWHMLAALALSSPLTSHHIIFLLSHNAHACLQTSVAMYRGHSARLHIWNSITQPQLVCHGAWRQWRQAYAQRIQETQLQESAGRALARALMQQWFTAWFEQASLLGMLCFIQHPSFVF